MQASARNWVFLGDSLTEGVGSKRISYVTELVSQLRSSGSVNSINVHEFRLRAVDSPKSNGFIDFNIGGLLDTDPAKHPADLWLWNLACEGETIESDFRRLSFIATLRPELVVVFRGSLESIIRPGMLAGDDWPWWVPRSWRGYAAMDPRCYFSDTWWRNAKQTSLDALKQKVRLKLLRTRPGNPLLDLEQLARYQTDLLRQLRELGARVLALGLLPVDDARFPGSSAYFKSVNTRLKQIAAAEGAEFFDWGLLVSSEENNLFYRDGFHPNEAGVRALARVLRKHLCGGSTS